MHVLVCEVHIAKEKNTFYRKAISDYGEALEWIARKSRKGDSCFIDGKRVPNPHDKKETRGAKK